MKTGNRDYSFIPRQDWPKYLDAKNSEKDFANHFEKYGGKRKRNDIPPSLKEQKKTCNDAPGNSEIPKKFIEVLESESEGEEYESEPGENRAVVKDKNTIYIKKAADIPELSDEEMRNLYASLSVLVNCNKNTTQNISEDAKIGLLKMLLHCIRKHCTPMEAIDCLQHENPEFLSEIGNQREISQKMISYRHTWIDREKGGRLARALDDALNIKMNKKLIFKCAYTKK